MNILEVRNLTVWFPRLSSFLRRRTGENKAVTNVSFNVPLGKTVGLVGESGSGKTTIGMAILKLVPLTKGSIQFRGKEITNLPERAFRPLRRQMQMIFQDPYGSLNPRWDILKIVTEPLRVHFPSLNASQRESKAAELLQRVGLKPEFLRRFPHEFSGGQRQRIGIARAIILGPKLVVCDEPVSALDVSIQAQIVNLLMQLQRELGLTLILISHDLAIVRHISHHILVLYLGRVMEAASRDELYAHPRSGPRTEPPAHGAGGRSPLAARSAKRLRIPHPLPAGDFRLRRDRAAGGRGERHSPRRLPPLAGERLIG